MKLFRNSMCTHKAISFTFTGKVSFATNLDAINNSEHDWTPIKYQNALHRALTRNFGKMTS